MTDRRRVSGSEDRTREEQNPFAPPQEGATNQSRASRRPEGHDGDSDGDSGADDGNGRAGQGNGRRRLPWSRKWSSRQPAGQSDGFGQNPEDLKSRPRWDPNDPKQRHARYALLAGAWGIFPALLGWEWLALLTAALGLHWGISALRGAPGVERDPEKNDARLAQAAASDPDIPDEPASTAQEKSDRSSSAQDPARRRTLTAAIAGLALATVTLGMVAGNFGVQMVYQDFFQCSADALTITSEEACADLLPETLHPIYIDNAD